jgi:hypothetical protein
MRRRTSTRMFYCVVRSSAHFLFVLLPCYIIWRSVISALQHSRQLINTDMVSLQLRRSAFLNDVGVCIAHSLQAALLLLEKVRSYERMVDSKSYKIYACSASTQCHPERLVQYLQEAPTTTLSFKNVCDPRLIRGECSVVQKVEMSGQRLR